MTVCVTDLRIVFRVVKNAEARECEGLRDNNRRSVRLRRLRGRSELRRVVTAVGDRRDCCKERLEDEADGLGEGIQYAG